MNHKQRRKVRTTLLRYRRKTGRAPEDIAAQLGWPIAFYLEAEAGKAGLSDGQKADVRAMIQREIKAATVRDQLRGASKPRRIPLIGGVRVVEHISQAEANDEVRKLEDHMNKHGRTAEQEWPRRVNAPAPNVTAAGMSVAAAVYRGPPAVIHVRSCGIAERW